MKILIFSALRNLFCSRMGSNGRKLLKMVKNDSSKPKLMILRKFCFFSEIFLKIFPILRWIRHFQRDETRDAEESGGGEWYQIVR